LALVHQDGVLRLKDRHTDRVLAEQDAGQGPLPPFARDWPAGKLRDRLVKVVKVRALIHLVTLEGAARALDHTDPRSGRDWRLEFLELRVQRGGREMGFPHIVSVRPLDGRDKGGKRLAKRIRAAGLRPLPPTLLEPALLVARIRPGAYTSRIRVPLDPELPAREAAVLLARRLLGVMEDNLKGMRQDVDTEFLHDYRVAMRRTRSLLALLKGIFPAEVRDAYRDRFRDLGAVTGPVRDLDVYLLRYSDYKSMVPAKHHPGLQELFALAVKRRAESYRQMVDRIDAGDFRAVMRDWREVLDSSATWKKAPARGKRPIAHVAARVVEKRYAKVCARGREMGEDPSDAELHKLRIDCKKFRYALEFFTSLLDRAKVDGLLEIMKRLQDLLGDHNDLVVQELDLVRLRERKMDFGLTKAALRTAGILEKGLAARRAELREGFAATFAEFASKKTAKRVRKLVRRLDRD
jgi:CHAD domain-containing protein